MVDSMLSRLAGRSLLSFVPEPVASPWLWPHLSISADQGSDGWTGQGYLKFGLGANLDFWPDWSHGTQNDIVRAWSALGFGALVRLMAIVGNLAHGPWVDGSRCWELSAGGDHYFEAMAPTTCPLFLHYYDQFVDELRLSSADLVDDGPAVVWDALQHHWMQSKRNSKVALSREGPLLEPGRLSQHTASAVSVAALRCRPTPLSVVPKQALQAYVQGRWRHLTWEFSSC